MNVRLSSPVTLAFAFGAALGVLVGCQTYDFEPVEPVAVAQDTDTRAVATRKAKPNLMILLDKSGSMNLPTGPDPDCGPNCGVGTNLCDAGCPTRISELRVAMNNFLTSDAGLVARIGLTTYPTGQVCETANAVRIPITATNDVEADLRTQAATINAAIQQIRGSTVQSEFGQPNITGGGTPTSSSLSFVGGQASLNAADGRDDLILLLTDGLPNCNANNPNDYSVNQATCRCTLSGGTCTGQFTKSGCLDKDATTAQVAALKAKGIRTIVVGFGADTASGAGPETLNAMAEAGGFARGCPDGGNGDCGAGDTCQVSTKLCTRRFFQAANAAELTTVLEGITQKLGAVDPCLFELETSPSDPRLVQILVGRGGATPTTVTTGADTWVYQSNPAGVKFQGALCQELLAASEANPLTVEIKVVQKL